MMQNQLILQLMSINLKISPEEKIVELEDKLTRSFAELENQRRRFEKEKDEAFDYGGMVFARDALNDGDSSIVNKIGRAHV